MQLSYNIIKKSCAGTNTVYTIKPPLVPVKVEPLPEEPDAEVEMSIEEARMLAENIINDAQRKAQDIVNSARETARADAERIKKEAFDAAFKKGYNEGYEKGKNEGLKSVENLRVEAGNVLEEAHRISRDYIDGQKEEILNLALHIGEKIIKWQVDSNDSVVVEIAKGAIEAAVVREQVIIRVNPMDYALVDCRRDELIKSAGEDVIVNIIRDDSIGRGGCRIESEGSFVDASIDAQFAKVKEALMGR